MTEIRWEPAEDGGFTGHVGTLEAFRIAPSGEGEKWTWHLTSRLPGQQDDHGWAMDPAVIKATAEKWHGTCLSARPYVAAALTGLRDEIQHLRTAAYDVATSLCDEGRTISAERAFGKVDALDQVLALMAHTGTEG